MKNNERNKRKLESLLRDSQRLFPKKYQASGGRTIVVLPSSQKIVRDHSYTKEIDKKVIEAAGAIAERLAITIVRETLSSHLDTLVDKITKAVTDSIGEGVSIQQAIPQIKQEAKDFILEQPQLFVDRSKDLELHGSIGKKEVSKDTTDEALDALENLI